MTTNRFTSLILIICIASSCCKSICTDKTLFVTFVNVRSINADSVSFIQYTNGSNFTQKIDSFFLNIPVAFSDTSYSSLWRRLDSGFEWKIINHSLNKEYRLNNFGLEKIKCCSDRALVVRSYQVNGMVKEGDYFNVE